LLAICFCLLLMLLGVGLCSYAGKWREKQSERQSERGHYLKGIAFCVVSGLFCATGNLAFVAGGGGITAGQAQGLSSFAANGLVLAYVCLFLFAINAGYCLVLLLRHSSFSLLLPNKTDWRFFLFGLLMGIFWMASFLLYGIGARAMGRLGL